jgi:hypothetical protein
VSAGGFVIVDDYRERLLSQDAGGDRIRSGRWRLILRYEVVYERAGRTWTPPPFRAEAGLMDRNFLIFLATECPLNLPAVAFARKTFERIWLFRADLPMMAEWEWYVRSAAPRSTCRSGSPIGGPITPISSPAISSSRSPRSSTSAERSRFFARTQQAGVAAAVLPEARTLRMRCCLAGAAECLRNGRPDLAARNV